MLYLPLLLHWKELFEFWNYLVIVVEFFVVWFGLRGLFCGVWGFFLKYYSSYFSSKSEKQDQKKARQTS